MAQCAPKITDYNVKNMRKSGSHRHLTKYNHNERSTCCTLKNALPRDLVSLGEHLKTHLQDHTRYDQGPEIHGRPKRVSLPLRGGLKIL